MNDHIVKELDKMELPEAARDIIANLQHMLEAQEKRAQELEAVIRSRDAEEEASKVSLMKKELDELSNWASWENGNSMSNRLSKIAYYFLRRSELAEQELNRLRKLTIGRGNKSEC